MSKPLIALALCLSAAPALAADPPKTPSCLAVPYNPLAFTPLNTLVGGMTTLIFAPDERVIGIWSSGNDNPPVSGPKADTVRDAPLHNTFPLFTDHPGTANITVRTLLPSGDSEHAYQFFVHADAPKDGDVNLSASYCVQLTYAAQQAQAKAAQVRETWAERKERRDREIAEARMAVDINYGPHNWHYMVIGDASILPPPDGIWDNSRQTAFVYPGNSQLPEIKLADGEPWCDADHKPPKSWLHSNEHWTDTRTQNDLFLVKQVFKHVRVRRDGKTADVSNCAYDQIGTNFGTGTISQDAILQPKTKPPEQQ